MFLTILTIISIYWLIVSLFAFYNVRKIFKYYSVQPKIQLKQQWKALLRSDFNKWNQKAIMIGCFIRFPYHVIVLGFFLISFVILVPISKLFGKRGRYYFIKFQKFCGNLATRQTYKFKQQINYVQYKIQTPIVISNHVNWFDIWAVGISLLPISIVSKAIIKRIPILGTLGDFFQAIYVQRTNQNQRNTIADQINQRVQKWMKQNNNNTNNTTSDKYDQIALPIIIFPQGTTSNGRSILTFKNGAFNSLAPITIFTLKYSSQQFQMGMGDISQAQHVFITLCLKPTVQINHKIVYPLKNQTVDEYCKRCRNIMSQMTGYQQIQCGFRDSLEYQKTMEDQRKKLKLM